MIHRRVVLSISVGVERHNSLNAHDKKEICLGLSSSLSLTVSDRRHGRTDLPSARAYKYEDPIVSGTSAEIFVLTINLLPISASDVAIAPWPLSRLRIDFYQY